MIQWDVGDLPAKIWGFIDLSALPDGTNVALPVGKKTVEKGVYAIVESADYVEVEENPGPTTITSDLFTEILLETDSGDSDDEVDPGPLIRKFYLVDVETFLRPMVVIPNIGSPLQYFEMTPKAEWATQFAAWIEADHAYDSLEMAPTEPDSSEADELDSSGSEDAS
jgi:hypothetical protein